MKIKLNILKLVALSVLTSGGILILQRPILHADSNIRIVTREQTKTFDNHIYLEEENGNSAHISALNTDTIAFIKEIAPHAIEAGSENNIYPSVTIAQAILESGNGKSKLSDYHNLFGIKGPHNGASVKMPTYEHKSNGEKYEITADFAAYSSRHEAIMEHGKRLGSGLNGFYSGVWRSNAPTYKEATKFLEGRYATDPSYSTKLNKLIIDYNLTRFDDYDVRDELWLTSDSTDPFHKPVYKHDDSHRVEDELMKQVMPKDDEKIIHTGLLAKDAYSERLDIAYINERIGVPIEELSQLNTRYQGVPKAGDLVIIERFEGEIVAYVDEVSDGVVSYSIGSIWGNKIIGDIKIGYVSQYEYIAID